MFTHRTRESPQNQIQLAFRNHWTLFNNLFNDPLFNGGKRVLEIGCGRGSLSCYFSDAGYECTLLDYSEKVIGIAKSIFAHNSLKATFTLGDANVLPVKDNSFDIIFSIGLLEHFHDIDTPLHEQIRILSKGGVFLGYVVPQYTNNIQKQYDWINTILKGYVAVEGPQITKEEVFRSDADSKPYIRILEQYGLRNIKVTGVYPLPMISHSIAFPFTLMPAASEKAVCEYFTSILEQRKQNEPVHPWMCEEGYGQAFLIWGFK